MSRWWCGGNLPENLALPARQAPRQGHSRKKGASEAGAWRTKVLELDHLDEMAEVRMPEVDQQLITGILNLAEGR